MESLAMGGYGAYVWTCFGLAAAVLTAFYMMRLFVMTFLGKPRDQHIHDHAHEGGFSMQMPLIVLGIGLVVWSLRRPALGSGAGRPASA